MRKCHSGPGLRYRSPRAPKVRLRGQTPDHHSVQLGWIWQLRGAQKLPIQIYLLAWKLEARVDGLPTP